MLCLNTTAMHSRFSSCVVHWPSSVQWCGGVVVFVVFPQIVYCMCFLLLAVSTDE